MTHTKGPWFINKSVDLEEWLPCITTSQKEGQDNPAYNGDGLVMAIHPDFQPSESDARLIAAAPELLDVLRRILSAHDSGNNGAVMGEAVLCQMFSEMARAAIRKATEE